MHFLCCVFVTSVGTGIEVAEVQDDENVDPRKESNKKKAKTPAQLEALKEIYRGKNFTHFNYSSLCLLLGDVSLISDGESQRFCQ